MGLAVVSASSVVPANSSVPSSPPLPTRALHDAVAVPQKADVTLRVTPDAVAGAAFEPLL